MMDDDRAGLVRVVVVGTTADIALLASLRISGTRTLAMLTAFSILPPSP